MRIIGGKHKGLKLIVPKGLITRPTTDRVRENIFNILNNMQVTQKIPEWENINVIDGFCGTGALGLEALSRGAKTALFIDQDKQAINTCKKNISSCKIISSKVKIKQRDTVTYIQKEQTNTLYSLVFLDPPYGKGLGIKTLNNLKKYNWLEKNTLCVLETDKIQPEEVPENILVIQEKIYGRIKLQFLINKE